MDTRSISASQVNRASKHASRTVRSADASRVGGNVTAPRLMRWHPSGVLTTPGVALQASSFMFVLLAKLRALASTCGLTVTTAYGYEFEL